jgi:hypothetical protein
MINEIRLQANETYTIQFATRGVGEGLPRFAWAHVVWREGKAEVGVIDTNGVAQAALPVPVPGIFSTVVRESSFPTLSLVIIKAGPEGFTGEIHLELLHAR